MDISERTKEYIVPYKDGVITIKPLDPPKVEFSPYYHETTNFTPTWITLVTDVDTFFSPAAIPLIHGKPIQADIRPLQASTSSALKEFKKLDTADTLNLLEFKDDRREGSEYDSSSASSIRLDSSSIHQSGKSVSSASNANGEGSILQVPDLVAPPPTGVSKTAVSQKPGSSKSNKNLNNSLHTASQVSFYEAGNESTVFDKNASVTSLKSSSSQVSMNYKFIYNTNSIYLTLFLFFFFLISTLA